MEPYSMSVSALIVAAGRGIRAGGSKPPLSKQHLPPGGRPMLPRGIGAFADHPNVDEVMVVIQPEDLALYESATKAFAGRLRTPVSGGARRQDSVRAGLESLAANPPDCVLIHDAARPFVDAGLIGRVIGGLDSHAGALPCL